MFRQVKSPAYGTGIATNLVSDEERQRYNYGGRVRAQDGLYSVPSIEEYLLSAYGSERTPWLQAQIDERQKNIVEPNVYPERVWEGSNTKEGKYVLKNYKPDTNLISQGQTEYLDNTINQLGDWDPDEAKTKEIEEYNIQSAKDIGAIPNKDDDSQGDITVFDQEDLEKAKKRIDRKGLPKDDDPALNVMMGDSDEIDIASLVGKYYDKKKALGEGQLGLAGAAIKAGFQRPSDAAATVGDALGKFGTTVTADEKALKKAAMTGEMYNEIYKQRAIEKGKQDRYTKKFVANLPDGAEDWNPIKKFQFAQANNEKNNDNSDDGLAGAIRFALGNVSVIPLAGNKAGIKGKERDAGLIASASDDTIFVLGGQTFKKDGKGGITLVSWEELGITVPQEN